MFKKKIQILALAFAIKCSLKQNTAYQFHIILQTQQILDNISDFAINLNIFYEID